MTLLFDRRLVRALSLSAVAALGLLITSGRAVSAYSSRVNQSCSGDYHRFCAKYEVGSTKLRRCMDASRRRLSRRCVDALVRAGMVPRRLRRR